MRTIPGALGGALLVGVLAGLLARAAMRVVALATAVEPHLSVTGTTMIVVVFVLGALLAAVGAMLPVRLGWRLLVAAPGVLLVLLGVAGPGVSEVTTALTAPATATGADLLVVGAALTVVVAAVAAPLAGWRLGDAVRRGRAGYPAVAPPVAPRPA